MERRKNIIKLYIDKTEHSPIEQRALETQDQDFFGAHFKREWKHFLLMNEKNEH